MAVSTLRIFAALCGALPVVGSLLLPSPVSAVPAGANLVAPLTTAAKWHLQTLGKAKAAMKSQAGVDLITTTAVDGTDFHAQLQYLNPTLAEGKTYTLRFRAKANAKRVMPVYAIVNGGDYHGIGLRQFASLTPSWRVFAYTFQAKDLGSAKLICPEFTLGNAVGTVYLADVSLKPAAPGTALTPPSDPPAWALQVFDPAVSTLKNDGDAHVVTITKTDGEPWHVQLNRVTPAIKDGQVYTVHFRVKADAARSMMFGGQVGDGDYHPILDQQEISIDTDWREYTYHVIPHNSNGHPVLFPQFLLGKQPGTVSIDQVTVTSADDAKADAPNP